MNKKTKIKKTIPTFSINLDQMYLDTKQPKKHQQKFKKYLLDKQLTKEKTMNGIYQRDSNEAFENAKSKGLDKPNEYMYMYSKDNKDFFKNINFRNYISFEQ